MIDRISSSIFQVLFWCIALTLLFSHLSVSFANVHFPISRVCEDLASELDQQAKLSGRQIQISENNFWERSSKINLPFSKVLSDALAEALSKKNATICVQELGDEPLKLVGNYARDGNVITVVIRLRRMGEIASQDEAIVAKTMPISDAASAWFEPHCGRIARTIIRLLEERYTGINTVNIGTIQVAPGCKGQPPLLFGNKFKTYLASAMASSFFLSRSDSLSAPSSGLLKTSYSIIKKEASQNGRMDLVSCLMDKDGIPLSSSEFSIPLSEIPEALLKPMAPKSMSVCIRYNNYSCEGLSPDTMAVHTAMHFMNEALAQHGILTTACEGNAPGQLKIDMTIQARQKEKGQGYHLLTGKLDLKVLKGEKQAVGSVSKKFKKLFKNDFEGAVEKSIHDVFKRSNFSTDVARLIMGRSDF